MSYSESEDRRVLPHDRGIHSWLLLCFSRLLTIKLCHVYKYLGTDGIHGLAWRIEDCCWHYVVRSWCVAWLAVRRSAHLTFRPRRLDCRHYYERYLRDIQKISRRGCPLFDRPHTSSQHRRLLLPQSSSCPLANRPIQRLQRQNPWP